MAWKIRKRSRGSITVFMALILSLVVSLICTGIESVRMAAARTQILAGMDIGLYSLFAQYDQALLKEYDLFALDISNGAEDLDLAFLIDVSGSMQFPSKLNKTGNNMVLTQSNLNESFPGSVGPYYYIYDPTGTSTVYRLFKENNTWYAVDASYSNSDTRRFPIACWARTG